MRNFCAFVAALLLASAAIYLSPLASAQKTNKMYRSENGIRDQYIVVLADDVENVTGRDLSEIAAEMSSSHRGNVQQTYSSALKGFAVEMSDADAEALSSDPRVRYVEQDAVVEAADSQPDAPWSLSRVDQPSNFDYVYDYSATGSGINVYVLDTGILTEHVEFGGRATDASNPIRESRPVSQCNGHGTHVAGTIGSASYGVAKNANLFSVRVLDCVGYGTVSSVVSGLDFVVRRGIRPAVANLSLGTPYSSSMNDAVNSAVAAGITVVVAAGNESGNACSYSPSAAASAITVGATGVFDERISFSNTGSCVDIYAPGLSVTSTWNQAATPVHTMSGTSTASPHVAGAAALYLERNPLATPFEVTQALLQNATRDIVVDAGEGTANRFLFTNFVGPGGSGCSGNLFSGSLSSTGTFQYQSSSSGFSGNTGRYKASLAVPTGNQFKLSLEQKSKNSWATIASSPGTSSLETVDVSSKRGTYRWRVTSLNGTGDYSLCSVTP